MRVVNHLGIVCAINNYCRDSGLPEWGDSSLPIEFGNLLPQKLVDNLVAGGADVSVYRHKGSVATVVSITM